MAPNRSDPCDSNEPVHADDEQTWIESGWERRFVAEEPRLSEAVEMYESLGFEVAVVPVDLKSGGCTVCMQDSPCRLRVIFTRPRA